MNDNFDFNAVEFTECLILSHIAEFLAQEGAEDMAQITDEYILRQMAKFDCFSLNDVIELRDQLAAKCGIYGKYIK